MLMDSHYKLLKNKSINLLITACLLIGLLVFGSKIYSIEKKRQDVEVALEKLSHKNTSFAELNQIIIYLKHETEPNHLVDSLSNTELEVLSSKINKIKQNRTTNLKKQVNPSYYKGAPTNHHRLSYELSLYHDMALNDMESIVTMTQQKHTITIIPHNKINNSPSDKNNVVSPVNN